MKRPKHIAKALSRVHKVTKKNRANVIRSKDISRSDRELLIKTNWLLEIIKGWYLLVRPDVNSNDSTIWYSNFWNFLRLYLFSRFGNSYCLSAVNSLELHSKKPTIPKKVVVITARGGSGIFKILPFNTSLLVYSDIKFSKERTKIKGLQVMTLPFLLCKIPSIFFKKNPGEMEISLRLIKDPRKLSDIIIKYNFKEAANRIIGAYLFLKAEKMAENIKESLAKFGMTISIKNPFGKIYSSYLNMDTTSPYVNRIIVLWENYRKVIIKNFPNKREYILNKENCLKKIREIYKQDAYHSLSIEGYEVSPELIELVKNNKWDPNLNIKERNALAAKGYYEAFKAVEISIKKMLSKKNPGTVISEDLQKWFLKLFSPSVKAGILLKKDLLGYRKSQVFIRGSRHVPYPREVLIDSMETLFYLLKKEKNAVVRAILGHFIFVYIHPYMDGNGRIARFIMNAMFVSFGYPWTVIHLENRKEYMSSLEKASVDKDIKPFVNLIKKEMQFQRKEHFFRK